MKPPSDLIATLNSMAWRKPTVLSLAAKDLVHDFLDKMRFVIQSLVATEGVLPGEAFDIARTAGPESETNRDLFADLFKHVTFHGAGVRETLILPIVSFYCWDEDVLLCKLPNPWSSVMELYKQGYTTDFDVPEDWHEVNVIIGYGQDDDTFRLV